MAWPQLTRIGPLHTLAPAEAEFAAVTAAKAEG
jgi:hypothetical protein